MTGRTDKLLQVGDTIEFEETRRGSGWPSVIFLAQDGEWYEYEGDGTYVRLSYRPCWWRRVLAWWWVRLRAWVAG